MNTNNTATKLKNNNNNNNNNEHKTSKKRARSVRSHTCSVEATARQLRPGDDFNITIKCRNGGGSDCSFSENVGLDFQGDTAQLRFMTLSKRFDLTIENGFLWKSTNLLMLSVPGEERDKIISVFKEKNCFMSKMTIQVTCNSLNNKLYEFDVIYRPSSTHSSDGDRNINASLNTINSLSNQVNDMKAIVETQNSQLNDFNHVITNMKFMIMLLIDKMPSNNKIMEFQDTISDKESVIFKRNEENNVWCWKENSLSSNNQFHHVNSINLLDTYRHFIKNIQERNHQKISLLENQFQVLRMNEEMNEQKIDDDHNNLLPLDENFIIDQFINEETLNTNNDSYEKLEAAREQIAIIFIQREKAIDMEEYQRLSSLIDIITADITIQEEALNNNTMSNFPRFG